MLTASPLLHDPAWLSRRTVAFLLIIGLHVLLIYGFASGLAQTMVRVITNPIQSRLIQEPRVLKDPPPPLPFKLVTKPLETPIPPLVPVSSPADADAIHVVPAPLTQIQPTHSTPAPPRIMGGPSKGFPNTDDYYPSAARRLGETGTSIVRVCVDAAGHLTTDPVIERSSSSARIDQGALKLARAGSGHYRATTEDGRPVSSCFPFSIRFTLQNQ